MLPALAGLNAAGGVLKVVTKDGSLTVDDTVSAASDILLEARGTASDITINAAVSSTTGHVTLNAADDITLNANLTTGGAGTVVFIATNNDGGTTLGTDGITSNGTITTDSGDVLLNSAQHILLNALITTTDGDVGLIGAVDIEQTSTGDITTTTGDVAVDAGNNWTMAGDAEITFGGGDFVGIAGGDISLGVITATNAVRNDMALQAGGSILDSNAAAINVQETVSAATTSLSMVATVGSIGADDAANGDPSRNDNAIDTNIDVLAAMAGGSIYVCETNDLTIGSVNAVTVNVNDSQRVNFNSTRTAVPETRMLPALAGLNAAGGVLKVVTKDGSLTVDDTVSAASDILLEARGTASDITINAAVSSTTGHVTLNAADDITLNANLTTGGAGTVVFIATNNDAGTTLGTDGITSNGTITTDSGDVLLNSAQHILLNALITTTDGDVGLIAAADIEQTSTGDITTTTGDVAVDAANNWTMAGDAEITFGGGDFVGIAGTNISLGVISATNAVRNDMALQAGGSIQDSNAAAINVQETVSAATTSLSMVATVGSIGADDAANGDPSRNDNAIDTNIDVLAAMAGGSIYVCETNDLTIGSVNAVTVNVNDSQRVNFNSTTTAVPETRMLPALAGLDAAGGVLKVVTKDGSLTVDDTISAASDILLEARGTASDITINAAVSSTTGHVTLNAADDITLNAALTTGGSGTVVFIATNNDGGTTLGTDGITSNGTITTDSGDVLLNSAQHILLNALITTTDGDVGLIAAADIEQTSTGDITTTTGDVAVDAANNWTMAGDAEITFGGGDFVGIAGGDISLGVISATNAVRNDMALQAGGSIQDSNAAAINVQETVSAATTSLSMVATVGSIGADDAANGDPSRNDNAIDTNIDVLAAMAGGSIYVCETNDLTIGSVNAVTVNVNDSQRVNFNSTTTAVPETRMLPALAGLDAVGGVLKVVTKDGSLTVDDTVSAASDILLEARGTASDITINAAVSSTTGHVTLNAADDITLNANLTTGGAGTVVFIATNNDGGTTLGTDGITSNGTITTDSGDVLLNSAQHILLNALITTTDGDVGLIAAADIEQTSTGDITTTTGDVAVDAGNNWTMAGDAEITFGGGDFVGIAGSDISLGVITATNAVRNDMALQAGGSIQDSNAAAINVQETVSAATTSLSMVATVGSIGADDAANGDPSRNDNAIDTNIDVLAAMAGGSIYVCETNDLTIGSVNAVTVNVNDSQRVNFNSTTTAVPETRMLPALAGLNAAGGVLKVVTKDGSLTVDDTVSADSDILLEARGTASDITINAAVSSTTGHVTLNAADDITLNAALTTGGSGTVVFIATNNDGGTTLGTDGITSNGTITTDSGDVLLNSAQHILLNALITTTDGDVGLIAAADIEQTSTGDITTTTGDVAVDAANNWTMAGDAEITFGGGDFVGIAGTNISLGVISATNAVRNDMALQAGGSIQDSNAAAINVQETVSAATTSLSMVATVGSIGADDAANGDPSRNDNAIDTNIDVLAAMAGGSIYVCETNDLTIGSVNAVTVNVNDSQRVNFNSTTTAVPETRMLPALAGLNAAGGVLKVVTKDGSLTVDDTISAASDILLEARGTASDITINAAVSSTTGHVTLNAADDITLNAALTTGGSGTVVFIATNNDGGTTLGTDGITSNGTITTDSGDVLLNSAQHILLNALITTTDGDVGLIAAADIEQTSTGDITTTTGDVAVDAANNWTMAGDAEITFGGGDFVGIAGTNISLGVISATNAVRNDMALQAGGSILDSNAAAINVQETVPAATTSLSMVATVGSIGADDAANGDPSRNDNAIDTNIDVLAAMAGGSIYVCETNDLTIGSVNAVTVNVNDSQRVNFNSTRTAVPETRMLPALAGLNAAGGVLKVVTKDGSLTVDDTVSAASDILLEARGTASDITINAAVSSTTGHVTLNAADDITLNANLTTGGAGTVVFIATNNDGGTTLGTDGITSNGTITTDSGDVLLNSAQHILLNALITTTDGDVGLIGAVDIEQTSTGDITTTTGDVAVDAGNNWTMAGDAEITFGGGDFVGIAGGDISLGVITATNAVRNDMALQAGGSILDSNAAAINVQETVSAATTSLSMVATVGSIGADDAANGDPSRNDNAIDTNIDVLAAMAGGSIYVCETNDLTIGSVNAVTVNVNDSQRVNFNSTRTAVPETRMLPALAGLNAAGGVLKVVTKDGSLTVDDTVSAASDILLEARGTASDITINAAVSSTTGHVTLNAADDITLNANLTTGGAGTVVFIATNNDAGTTLGTDGITSNGTITTDSGDVLLNSAQHILLNALITTTDGDVGLIAAADIEQTSTGDITTTTGDVAVDAANNWTMAGDAEITFGGGDFVGIAGTNISLGVISATNAVRNDMALQAGGSIQDSNAAAINVQETVSAATTSLSMVATVGSIGADDAANGDPSRNDNAIDTNIDVLAAMAGGSIYVCETNDLTIGSVNAVTVNVNDSQRVNFNSTTTAVPETRMLPALAGLDAAGGVLKVVTKDGSLTVDDTISAASDILLEARGTASDITINAAVSSTTGHVTLNAADDITLNAALTTGGSGTVVFIATNNDGGTTLGTDGITSNGTITTDSGDVLLNSAQHILLNALITTTDGDVGLIAAADIEQTSTGDITTTTGDVAIDAGNNWTMAGDAIDRDANAVITFGGSQLVGRAGGNIDLAILAGTNNSTNTIALQAAASILDSNAGSINIEETVAAATTFLSLRAFGGSIGEPDVTSFARVNLNAIDTNVDVLAAVAATGIYVCEANEIIVGDVASASVAIDDVVQVNFNSTTSSVAETRGQLELEDLRTTADGPIKLIAHAGSITVTEGLLGNPGIDADGTGDVLLDARGAGSDIVLNGNAISDTGNIEFHAADDIDVNSSVSTGGAGTVYLRADNNLITDASPAGIDGIDIDGAIATANGDVFLTAATSTGNVRLNNTITTIGTVDGDGDVAIVTGDDIFINADITTGFGEVLLNSMNGTVEGDATAGAEDGVIMAAGTVIATGSDNNVLIQAFGESGDVRLGRIDAGTGNISIAADDDVLDSDAGFTATETVNLIAQDVRIVADADGNENGFIGGTDFSSSIDTNLNAIDIEVSNNLAARSAEGIYLSETSVGGDVMFGDVAALTVSVDVRQVNFNSTDEGVNTRATQTLLEDLTTTADGSIKVAAVSGSITVKQGANGDPGIDADGVGDVLLVARALGSDIIVDGSVLADSGNIEIHAGDDVDINAAIRTGEAGSIYLRADNGSATDALPAGIDGVDIDGTISTASGDVFITAASSTGNVRINSNLTTTGLAPGNGDVGLIAGDDILINANISTDFGDVLLNAANGTTENTNADPLLNIEERNDGVAMNNGTSITIDNSHSLLAIAGGNTGDIWLSVVDAESGNVSLSADDSIRDSNVNETVNIIADNLRMVADADGNLTGRIGRDHTDNGAVGTNVRAIDVAVSNNVAALSAQGIYLRETVAGGDIMVGDVPEVSVTVDVSQVNFNSTTTGVQSTDTLSLLEDLTTTNDGDIKLIAEAGTITVKPGINGDPGIDAHGIGDVLLEARGAASDIVINGSVLTDSGHITLFAADDIDINASMSITDVNGSLYVRSDNLTATDSAPAGIDGIDINGTLSTVTGDVFAEARTATGNVRINSDITTMGTIDGEGDVSITAGDDILQNANITTAFGDVHLAASNGTAENTDTDPLLNIQQQLDGVVMLAGTTITVGTANDDGDPLTTIDNNDVLITASGGSGDIWLGLIDADAGNVSLSADDSIRDSNVDETVNITTGNLRMVADADGNVTGRIGRDHTDNGAVATNVRAIDVAVSNNVAALSAQGIYLRETVAGGDIMVGDVPVVSVTVDVSQVNFNSTTTGVQSTGTLSLLEDLTTTNDGDIKLVAEAGTITVKPGINGDPGINAHGTGDVLLEARGAASDIVINGSVQSGTGDITFTATDDVDVNAAVATAGQGTLSVLAANNDLATTTTDGIVIDATLTNVDGDVLLNSAANILQNESITSATGDVGVIASLNIDQTSNGDITTTNGDLLVSAGIPATAPTATDLVLGHWTMAADTELTIGGVADEAADVVARVTGSVNLGVITLTNAFTNRVALESLTGSITDANAGSINIQESVAAATTTVSLRAISGFIGGEDQANGDTTANANAIDTDIDRLAAISANGIYVRELNDLVIDDVPGVTAELDAPQQVNFNSTQTPIPVSFTVGTLEDLTTTDNGPIKVVTEAGRLTINAGTDAAYGVQSHGTGDILLEARSANSDLIINANVQTTDGASDSGTGHITLHADDDVDIQANVSTGGDGTIYVFADNATDSDATAPTLDGVDILGNLTTVDGDVYLAAISNNGNVKVIGNAVSSTGRIAIQAAEDTIADGITSTTTDIVIATPGDLQLGFVSGNNVSLAAGNDIIDINGVATTGDTGLNVRATTLRIVADSDGDGSGSIGSPATSNGFADENANAIDIELGVTNGVDGTLAGRAAEGIYLREVAAGGNLTIGQVDAITLEINVDHVHFNSTRTDVPVVGDDYAGLEDLETTNNGPIKLVVENGTLTITDGDDADTHGVSANGTGDILLAARNSETATGSDIISNASITSEAGHISLYAADDIDLNATLSTAGTGTVIFVAEGNDASAVDSTGTTGSAIVVNGISIDADITTANGELLLNSADSIHLNAALTSLDTEADVALLAINDITQTSAGDITATTADVLIDTRGSWAMAGDAVITVGGSQFLGQADSDIDLGVITMTHDTTNEIAIQSINGNIFDSNSSDVNIQEAVLPSNTTLSLRADNGSIGTTDLDPVSTNDNAIDLNVDVVAAVSANGIYLREIAGTTLNNIEVNTAADVTVDIDQAQRVRFNSTRTPNEQFIRSIGELEDLRTTNNSPVKLVAENGTITINGGTNTPGEGLSADGTGDILLEARNTAGFTGSDVIVNSSITSGSGHATLDAADDIDLNATMTTGGNGTVAFLAGANNDTENVDSADNTDADITVDGISIDAVVTSTNGDILLHADAGRFATTNADIHINEAINTTAGDIGFVTTTDITQTRRGDVTTDSGEVLILAGNDWLMAGDAIDRNLNAEISVGGERLLAIVQNDIELGILSLTNANTNNVAIQAVNGSIADANAGLINIEETVATATTSLSLQAGTIVGGTGGSDPDANNNAIDLNVDTVAALSADGIYLRELAVGGDLEINTAAAVAIDIEDVVRANFNSSTTDVSQNDALPAVEDLTTSAGGSIKVVAENGTITVNGGITAATGVSTSGTGDLLLEARGLGSDVIVNATLEGGTGHVTLDADDDIDLNAALTTGNTGTVVLFAGTNDETANVDSAGTVVNGISVDAAITSAQGDVLVDAQTLTANRPADVHVNSTITTVDGDVGLIATTSVTLTSTGDVTTTNGDVLVRAVTDDWVMAGDALIEVGGQQLLGLAGANIELGQLSLTNASENHVALVAAGGSITDKNAADFNIQETVEAATTTVSFRALNFIGGTIAGTSTQNDAAIDLNVDVVAAHSGFGGTSSPNPTGIALRELADGGDIVIDTVDEVTVDIEGVQRSNFNSSTSDASQDDQRASLEDVNTTGPIDGGQAGDIRFIAENGTITVNGGSDNFGINASGAGDILLDARSTGQNVQLNADLFSDTGDVTILAANSITLADGDDDITTAGDGTVYLEAGTGSIILNAVDSTGIAISNASGDILLHAESDIAINAEITSSEGGNLGFLAGDDLLQTADITTNGGNVLANSNNSNTDVADNAGIEMAANTMLSTNGGNVVMHATGNGNIDISVIDAAAGNVSLSADNNITDSNAGEGDGLGANIIGTNLNLIADADVNNVGQIGDHNRPDDPTINPNAIDTEVTTVAAESATGIYLRETDAGGDLIINDMPAQSVTVTVNRQDFSSGETAISTNFTSELAATESIAANEDLRTTTEGDVQVVLASGSIDINGGTDGTGIVIESGNADVHVETLSSSGNIVAAADILAADTDGNPDFDRASDEVITLRTASEITASTTLTGGIVATQQSPEIQVASTSGITTGSRLEIRNDSTTDESSDNSAPGDSEFFEVVAVSGNTVTLSSNPRRDFPVGAEISIHQAGTIAIEDGVTISTDDAPSRDIVSGSGTSFVVDGDATVFVPGNVVTVVYDSGDFGEFTVDSASGNSVTLVDNVPDSSASNAAGTPVRILNTFSDTSDQIFSLQSTPGETSLTVDLSANPDIAQVGKLVTIANDTHSPQTFRIEAVNNADPAQTSLSLDHPIDTGSVFRAGDEVRIMDGDVTSVSMASTAGDSTIVLNDISSFGIGDTIRLVDTINNPDILQHADVQDEQFIITGRDAATNELTLDRTLSRDVATTAHVMHVVGDRVVLSAGDGVGNIDTVSFDGTDVVLNDLTIATDSGVAKQFAVRPTSADAADRGSAFFVNDTPINGTIRTSQPRLYEATFSLDVGAAGEENLRLDIDWNDPDNDAFARTEPGILNSNDLVTSQRYQRVRLDVGDRAYDVSHTYTFNEFVSLQQVLNDTRYTSDFAVSHHESINVRGGVLPDSPVGDGDLANETISGGQVSSTDNASTGFDPERVSLTENLNNQDLIFESGIVNFVIPSGAPANFFTEAPPQELVEPEVFVQEPTILVFAQVDTQNVDQSYVAAAGGTEVYFEIVREWSDGTTDTIKEEIKQEEFATIDDLEDLVAKPEFQDGTGYKVNLIIDTGSGKISRPVIEFEISGGVPGVIAEDLPDDINELQLRELPKGKYELMPAEPDDVAPVGGDLESAEFVEPPKAKQNPEVAGSSKLSQLKVDDKGYQEADKSASAAGSAAIGVLSLLSSRRLSAFRRNREQSKSDRDTSRVSRIMKQLRK